MSTLIEMFYGADAPTASAGELIYKEILREGEFPYTPTDKGLAPVPFRVVRDGPSSKKDRVISLAEVKAAFDQKAYSHVQIPLTDEQGKDHKDIAAVNTGFVEDLDIRIGEDGKARLVAGMRFTEPDIKGRVDRGTIANCSSGIYFDRLRPSDGAKFPVALRHVALTNTPFVDGLKPFGIGLSEDDSEEQPEEIISVAMSGEAIWSPNESLNALQTHVVRALEELSKSTAPLGIDDPNAKLFFPRDIATTKALVEEGKSGDIYVVPFKRKKDSVELAPQTEWTEAEQQWIAASDPSSPIAVYGRSVVEDALKPAEEEQRTEPEAVEATEPAGPQHDLSTPQGRLAAAVEDRQARLLMSDKHTRGGATVSRLDLSKLNLSDEERTALEALQTENERLQKERRTAEVDREIERVKGLGLSEQPGFLKTYRKLLLADDGQEAAVINLSEDGTGEPTGITLTAAIKELIDALPKNNEGKLALSEQHLVSGNHGRPDDVSPEEREETTEDKIADTRRRLGLPEPAAA